MKAAAGSAKGLTSSSRAARPHACHRRAWCRIAPTCDALLLAPACGRHGQRLQKRRRQHRQTLFSFLHRPHVSPDNKTCERALRKSLIRRKLSVGFRSEWGTGAFATMATLIETAAERGEDALCIGTRLPARRSPLASPSAPMTQGE